MAAMPAAAHIARRHHPPRPRPPAPRARPHRPRVRPAAGRRGARPGRPHVRRPPQPRSSGWPTASHRYAYLMTRRIERAMALLRRGDLSVTEVCFEVGCSSLGTFSTRFTELVGRVAQRLPARGAPATTEGMPPCVARQVTRPIRNREAPGTGPAWTAGPQHGTGTPMDLSIHRPSCRTPTRTPRWPSTGTRSTSRSAGTSPSAAMRWITVGPKGKPGDLDRPVPAHRRRRASPTTRRRTIAEMMAKGTYAMLLLARDRPRRRLPAPAGPATPRSSRSRPTSPTACATWACATRPATCSASSSCK